jgi:hypothetical protein|nr:MAG TPA: hypothetical protein [Bacteriophage sp.]
MGKNVKLDMTKFKAAYAKYMKEIDADKISILHGAAKQFAQYASLYAPPNMGKKVIDVKFYKRKLFYLPSEIKNNDNRSKQKDLDMLKQGFLFKVLKKIPLSNRFETLYFKKKTGKVKKLLKIANRGLLRASFGTNIETIGESIPTNIRRLLTKSKNIRNLKNFNKFLFNEKNHSSSLTIENDVADAQTSTGFAKIAVAQGDKQAAKYIKRKINEINKRVKDI